MRQRTAAQQLWFRPLAPGGHFFNNYYYYSRKRRVKVGEKNVILSDTTLRSRHACGSLIGQIRLPLRVKRED